MINNKLSDNFFKNIATLATGTIISQLILILCSPLLSRIYLVESFGKLAIFSGVTSFFAVFSTGRYELAIGLPIRDKDSLSIIKLIFLIGFFISLFFFVLILFFKEIIKYEDGIGFLNQKEVFISPLYIFIISIHSALIYWNQRKKRYKTIAFSNGIQIISSTIIGLFLGYCFDFQAGMIYSLIIGMFFSIIFLINIDNKLIYKIIKQNNVVTQLNKYIDFPKYSTLSDLSLVASQQLIPIVFSFFYNTTIVGLFSFANRIIRLPNIVITNAIGNVFRNEAIDSIRKEGNCYKLYLSTLKKLVVISFPLYFLLFITSPYFFSFVFGSIWKEAGKFAQIISIFLFFEFISTPLNTIFSIYGKQKKIMIYQLLNAISGMVSLFVGYALFRNEYISLILFALSSSIFNSFFIFQTYKISKVNL